jgi:ornithine decarboxylase
VARDVSEARAAARDALLEAAKALEYDTPFLLIDLDRVRAQYRAIRDSLPGVEVFYAIKANDHPAILRALAAEGSCFEVSSLAELRGLQQLGVAPDCIASFNPVKAPAFIDAMHAYGSTLMAVDSEQELRKLVAQAPGARVAVRLNVENEGSDWPLDDKFGVEPHEALALLRQSRELGLAAAGLTFHVGSQCRNPASWQKAIARCAAVWRQASAAGIELSVLSLGGGIPARHGKPTPTIQAIGEVIRQALRETGLDQRARLIIEPGRGIVAEAAVMVTRVIAKAKRAGVDWVYIDAGVFNGLMETICGFTYELSAGDSRPLRNVTLAGPSCDSVDVMFRGIDVPEVDVGDRLYIHNAGAYTTVYASSFNGFGPPAVFVMNEAP